MNDNPFVIVILVAVYVLLCLTHAKIKSMDREINDIKAAICEAKETK